MNTTICLPSPLSKLIQVNCVVCELRINVQVASYYFSDFDFPCKIILFPSMTKQDFTNILSLQGDHGPEKKNENCVQQSAECYTYIFSVVRILKP